MSYVSTIVRRVLYHWYLMGSPVNECVAQFIKNLPAMQEMQMVKVQFLCQEDLLEKEMATHSRILAWEISWTEEPGGLKSMGSQESDTT